MPELPEVETTRRGLAKTAAGRTIVQVTIYRHDLRQPITRGFAGRVEGTTITAIRRRAKYLLIDLDSGDTILAHLGMSGSFVVVEGESHTRRIHDHLVLALDNGRQAIFHDPRRFGVILLLKKGEEGSHVLLKSLGPEPLSKDFSARYLKAQLLKRKGPIKPVLMDQKLVVGVGNIYASESLYLSKISPFMAAAKAAPKASRIIADIRTTLNAAIDSGGSTLRDYVGIQNEGGYFQHHFKVYGRDGQPCFRCATLIETAVQAGRATYWCPQCQPIRKKRRKT